MRIASALVLILIAGCSEPPAPLTLQEKWAKVQAVNVQDSTVDQLTERLGPPYRSEDGETKRSRFWYPFEGVTSTGNPETAPMLIVIVDNDGEVTAFMRSEPVMSENAPIRIRPCDYMMKVDGEWKRGDLKTKKVLDQQF
jgi:hypothetical protein